ncbi:hypothetical protein JB92DRAFT_3094772, partial [Gautieria morchelliformis]
MDSQWVRAWREMEREGKRAAHSRQGPDSWVQAHREKDCRKRKDTSVPRCHLPPRAPCDPCLGRTALVLICNTFVANVLRRWYLFSRKGLLYNKQANSNAMRYLPKGSRGVI